MNAAKFLALFCFVLLSGWQVFGQTIEPPSTEKSAADAKTVGKPAVVEPPITRIYQTEERT